jgi:aminopeptidase N
MIAAGLAGAFKTYNRMNARSRLQMKAALESILTHESISKNVYEIVEKTLGAAHAS